jgi:hypothetical protein
MDKKPTLTALERKTIERAKKHALGLVRIEIWVHKSRKEDLLKIGKTMRKPI